ncbi:unnamed protein product [Cylindrotheca closterium]|uniref:Uncharacterized protein n=1 Tax=Cylindrotheca closterium TaxID=2856 RepID=A0AAD2FGM4_9STRA|nr:unnamed protein product [Cylindrotheca closterium]
MQRKVHLTNCLRNAASRALKSSQHPSQFSRLSLRSPSTPWTQVPKHQKRFLSSDVAGTATQKKVKSDDTNVFLDNLGKIFLATIAAIVGALIRSSYNTSNRNAVRDEIEAVSALDPVEIDELRIANSVLSPTVYMNIAEDLYECFPTGSCSYQAFTNSARKTMMQLKGEAFTIELGHQVDRVVADILAKKKASVDEHLPLSLWLVTLSLALNSSIDDRLRVLYKVLEKEEQPVRFHQIPVLVSNLQDTCQLPPDTQVVSTATSFPTQQWERGSPSQLVPWEGGYDDVIDLNGMADILRSKSVCAWGECYHKKSFQIRKT